MTESVLAPKTYLITGATRGLGRAAARALARLPRREPCQLILAVRDLDAGTRLAAELSNATTRVRAARLDLSSLADVRRFAAAPGFDGRLAGLACNAGGQSHEALRRTGDGWEETIAVNHLAHLALVDGLMPRLAGGRLVFIGSGTHEDSPAVRRFGFRGGRWSSARELAEARAPAADAAQAARDRYATSKLANIATAIELARRHAPAELQLFAFDPGLMAGTGLARNHPALLRAVWNWLLPLAALFMAGTSTTRRSGAVLAWLLTDPALAGQSGLYYDHRRRVIAASADARDPRLGARIVDESRALLAAV